MCYACVCCELTKCYCAEFQLILSHHCLRSWICVDSVMPLSKLAMTTIAYISLRHMERVLLHNYDMKYVSIFFHFLTLNVRGPSCLGLTRSISWLLMPWLLSRQGLALLTLSWDKNWDSHSLVNGYPCFYPRIAFVAPSPGHQQPWYWLCSICRPWSYTRKDFKFLCHINVE